MVKNMKRYMKVSERCDVAVQINDMIRQDKIRLINLRLAVEHFHLSCSCSWSDVILS
jgi:hypothetical protein